MADARTACETRDVSQQLSRNTRPRRRTFDSDGLAQGPDLRCTHRSRAHSDGSHYGAERSEWSTESLNYSDSPASRFLLPVDGGAYGIAASLAGYSLRAHRTANPVTGLVRTAIDFSDGRAPHSATPAIDGHRHHRICRPDNNDVVGYLRPLVTRYECLERHSHPDRLPYGTDAARVTGCYSDPG